MANHAQTSVEPASLEYMEDPYFLPPDDASTPSFDVAVDELDELENLVSWPQDDTESDWRTLPDLVESALCIETEFYMDNRRRRLRIFRKKMREVRVTFQDLSKPYLAKVSSHTNYKKFLGITPGAEEAMTGAGAGDANTPDELAGLTPEQAEQLRAEWSRELARVEDEIATLRTVLQSKIRQSSDLKRKLGITVWKEITEDVNQGLKNVKESQVYQKTESVIKTTAEKTTSIFGGITAGVSHKLGQMRNSESFRSIEERVGTAYENVKGKVASRSNSTQSFDEALRDASRAGGASGAASPSIPEHKPLP
ncbi:tumor protein D53 homolog isoform X3 [Vanessa tameamea]|uniref:Tumor protein D53 homolog isoform X3 n=1 Tax=Vanessa tameamea TaxID=334116 RepID=A0A8B8HSR6_VANTA|nr:tumor protein D53 homolog isoform X3 [Vanessa tameamea]XP_047545388.1 tumor protein D53 homolog isoform X3 [Vanessa atalanta]